MFVPDTPSPQDIPRIGQHFGATCESGLDGHPVFSDVPFDEDSGLLEAFDIGLNSEYVADCEALADIASVLGAEEERAELVERAATVRDAVRATLWDASAGIYRSHRTDTGLPTAFLAPTSFYPMFAGIATAAQSAEMSSRHLADPEGFGGRWAIPSFPRREVHDTVNPYWRDRAWPPMNFLVYLGLLRTGDADRGWLADECAALVLGEWREHRHIHENYSSRTGEGCDVDNSQPYLTWGALLSLVALIEHGEVGYFADWRPEHQPSNTTRESKGAQRCLSTTKWSQTPPREGSRAAASPSGRWAPPSDPPSRGMSSQRRLRRTGSQRPPGTRALLRRDHHVGLRDRSACQLSRARSRGAAR